MLRPPKLKTHELDRARGLSEDRDWAGAAKRDMDCDKTGATAPTRWQNLATHPPHKAVDRGHIA